MATGEVKVWDPLVRVFHWALVAGFFAAYLTAGEAETAHVWLGYAVLGLVAVRILWGFVGTVHARFADFVHGPASVLTDLKLTLQRRAPRYLGHSPVGGAMVVALLVFLLATTLSGIAVYGADEHAGPMASMMAGVSHDTEEVLEEVHEVCANVTLGLVVLHILGVAFTSFAHRENLVRAMFTGRKRPLEPTGS